MSLFDILPAVIAFLFLVVAGIVIVFGIPSFVAFVAYRATESKFVAGAAFILTLALYIVSGLLSKVWIWVLGQS